MADHDTTAVRERLERRIEEIESTRARMHAESQGAQTGELADFDQHPGDAGSETHDQEVEQTTDLFLDEERRRIDEALRALDDGTYGTCVVCGQEIPPARLEAKPEAVRCVEDQRRFEAEHRVVNQPPMER
jgi:RNA polymerase-binding transcription factor DksA